MESAIQVLPHVNAALNGLAVALLVAGWWLIKRKREREHKWVMLACFGVSSVFLVCYLAYHQLLHAVTGARGKPFEYQGTLVRSIYYTVLISHVVLAISVPILAGITIYLGLKDRRKSHRRIARWTFPIWLYVSVTGVIVYVMLYHAFRVETADSIMRLWLQSPESMLAAHPHLPLTFSS